MKCDCGAEIDPEQNICPACGAPVSPYRRCDGCGSVLAPDEDPCPVCHLRQEVGAAPPEHLPLPPRRLRLPLPALRLVLLASVLLAVLAGGYLLLPSFGTDPASRGATSALKAPRGDSGGDPSMPLRPISARIAATPTTIARPTAGSTPTPAATDGPVQARATAIGSSVVGVPTAEPGRAALGSGWTGWMTIASVSEPGANPKEQAELQNLVGSTRFEPMPITLDFEPASPETGTATLAEQSRAEDDFGLLDQGAVKMSLDTQTGIYVFRNGQVTLRRPEELRGLHLVLDGKVRRSDTRYLIEGTWKAPMLAGFGPRIGATQLWEGTWTVTRPRDDIATPTPGPVLLQPSPAPRR